MVLAGFDLEHKDEELVPMLMGGYAYVARREKYLIEYNVKDKNICLQINDSNYIDWNGEFILKFKNVLDDENLRDLINESIWSQKEEYKQ